MNHKKRLKNVLVILIIIVLCIKILSYLNNHVTRHIETEYGDNFIIKAEIIFTIPDTVYKYLELYDDNQETKPEFIVKLERVDDSFSDIEPFYIDNDIKCYTIADHILFRKKEQSVFQALKISDINRLDEREFYYLLPVVRKIQLESWASLFDVSDFLLKCNDKESIELTKRYSRGEFTDEEIRLNDYSNYTQEEIQAYCLELVKKYRIE